MNRITALPVVYDFGPVHFISYPVVLTGEDGLTLIDTSCPGNLFQLEEAFVKAGLDISKVKRILISHHDHDHMGALHSFLEKYQSVQVYASREQIPYITGKKKSLRLEQQEKVLQNLTGDARQGQLGFLEVIKSTEPVADVKPLEDGQELEFCKGVMVVRTDGHMPGHLSFYLPKEKTLISGDALVTEKGELCIAEPGFVLDKDQEIESLHKIAKLKIDKVICFHGGVYESNQIDKEIEQLASIGYKQDTVKLS